MKYLFFILWVLPVCVQAQHDSCRLKLSGYVLDKQSHEALAFASVYLSQSETGTITDLDGHFELNDLCPGDADLVISHLGCQSRTFRVQLTGDTAYTFHLEHDSRELNEVVVTEHREAYTGSLPTSSISSVRLQAISGKPLGTMLKEVPGVWTLQTGPSIAKPMIHGLHSNRVLIVQDGVRQEGQQWGSEHAPEIDPYTAGEITLIQGAAGVRYGSDAIGGVILVQPPPYPTDTAVHGSISLAAFSNSLGGSGATRWSGQSKKLPAMQWRATGSYRMGGDAATPNYRLANTAFRENNLSGAVKWSKAAWQTELGYSRFSTDLGILSASHIGNLTDLEIALQADTPLILRDFSYYIQAPYQHIVHQVIRSFSTFRTGDIGHLDLNIAYQDNHRQEYDLHRMSDGGPALDLSIGTALAEAEWKHRSFMHTNGSIGISAMNQQNVWTGRFFIPNFISNTAGVFWMENWVSLPWKAEAGVRYDVRKLRSFRNDGEAITETTRNFSHLSWSGGIGWQQERLSLSFNSGSAWRSPSINELYAAGLHHGAAALEYGDPDLQIETSWQNSLSAKWESARLQIDLGAYVNLMDGFIYLEPQAPPALTIAGAFPVFAYKQTNARLTGMDAKISYTLFREFSLEAGAAVLRAWDITNNDWIIQMPSDRLTGGFHWHFHDGRDQGWDISAGITHILEQSRVPDTEDYAPPPAPYTLLRMEAGSELHWGNTVVNWSLSADNLFNTAFRDYLDRYRYFADEPGRDISLHVFIPIQTKNKTS